MPPFGRLAATSRWWNRPILRLIFLAGSVVVVLAAAITATIQPSRGMIVTASQRLMIDRLVSVLMHDSTQRQYGRVVNQFDGRGYVAGIGDFTTAHGEALEVVQTYTARVGTTVLSRYLTALTRLARDGSGAIDDLAGLPDAWQLAGADARFRQAQEDVLNERFFDPSLRLTHDLGLTTPLALAVIYDTMLQHGNGTDAYSLSSIIARTPKRVANVSERQWLVEFLRERRDTLTNTNTGTDGHRALWPISLGRVDALLALVDANEMQLQPPLVVRPYSSAHVIDLRPDDYEYLANAPTAPATLGAQETSAVATPPAPKPPQTPAVPMPGPPTLTPPAPAVSGPRQGMIVAIMSESAGLYAGVAGDSTEDGAAIVLASAVGPAQSWRVVNSHIGCFSLLNVLSGLALDNPFGSGTDGAYMQQWTHGWGNYNQTWCIRSLGNDQYSIQNLASGSLLEVPDGSTEGAAVQQRRADPAAPEPRQTWRLVVVT